MADQTTDNVQPESPKHEGVDPLTQGDTLYPREDTRAESEVESAKENDAPADETIAANEKTDQTVADQNEVNAKANTPDSQLPADAQTANGVASDSENTDSSNKPETPSEPTTDTPQAQ